MVALVGNTAFPVNNVVIPRGGPKALPCTLDFSNTGTIEVDGEAVVMQGAIEYLQGVFVDNADNPGALTINTGTVGQRIKVPAGKQGYFPMLCSNPPKLTITTPQGVRVPVIFYNVPIQSVIW